MAAISDKSPRARRAKARRPLWNVRFGVVVVSSALGICYVFISVVLYSSLGRDTADGFSNTSDDSLPSNHVLRNTPRYSSENIAKTVHKLTLAPNRLLIYDPIRDKFVIYTVAPSNGVGMMRFGGRCNRCRVILPLLVNALLDCCGERFKPHRPPFQLLLSDADFTYSKCTRAGTSCDGTDGFAPTVHFGSVLKDASVLPFVQAFPNPSFLACMREWYLNKTMQQCNVWVPPYGDDLTWRDLTPQVIWRGSPFAFLQTLDIEYFNATNETSLPEVPFRPRAAAVTMSNRAKKKHGRAWLDAQTTNKLVIKPSDMADYRYQIDIGGAGGTSWEGTLEKIAMPGLLFHHETPSMDWFYPEMVAWKHYVPIRTDLSDLRERYNWAERNTIEAQNIARGGTEFARSFFSSRNLKQQYKNFFELRLKHLVDAYNSVAGETVPAILDAYHNMSISHKKVSYCTKKHCFIQTLHGARGFALNSSACFEVSNITSPKRAGPIETCYN